MAVSSRLYRNYALTDLLYVLSRPRQGILLGVLAGLGVAAFEPKLAVAQATLFFPPTLALQATATPSPEEAATAPPEMSVWAHDALTSKQAMDAVYKRIERQQGTTKQLRAAALLNEPGRLEVSSTGEYCLRLSVRAEDSTTARLLCEGLLAYLAFTTKIPLEDPEGDVLGAVQSQLRTQEKALSQTLWSMLAISSEAVDPSLGPKAELELSDFQASFKEYLNTARTHFFREFRAAATGPSFSVVEAPFAYYPRRLWLSRGLSGAALGLLFSFVVQIFRTSRRRPPAPYAQDPFSRDRTGSA